jgi:hypothetical protein
MSTPSAVPTMSHAAQSTKQKPGRAARAGLLKLGRQIHLYIGVFSAPALLFFAFSGALQTFSLHQAKDGSDYKPPKWIAFMAEIHKNQIPQLPRPKIQPGMPMASTKPEPATAVAKPLARPAHNPLPLKIFFVVISLSFFSSIFTGVYMSYKYNRSKTHVTAVLVAGCVVPILLMLI